MKLCTASAAVVLSTLAATASASIFSVSGQTTQLGSPPLSCAPGALTGFTAYAWDEKQNVALNLSVDMTNNPATNSTAIAGTVNGTYDSHFIHFEPLPGAVGVTGTVTFNDPIKAVIFTNLNLDNSDSPAGSPGTLYPTTYSARGLNSVPPSTFSVNANVLSFNFMVMIPSIDVIQVRVLTQTPAPGPVALLGLGAATLGLRRRR